MSSETKPHLARLESISTMRTQELVKARRVKPQIDIRLHTYHWLQTGPIYSTLLSKGIACHITNSSQSFASSSNP